MTKIQNLALELIIFSKCVHYLNFLTLTWKVKYFPLPPLQLETMEKLKTGRIVNLLFFIFKNVFHNFYSSFELQQNVVPFPPYGVQNFLFKVEENSC